MNVVYGSSTGLTAGGEPDLLAGLLRGIQRKAEFYDMFGWALADNLVSLQPSFQPLRDAAP